MTAKGHITLQKYCFYVSWQNLDLNFQPCRLQNSNKTNSRFTKIYRRFAKMKRRLVFLKRRFGSKGILLYLILRKIGFALSNDCVAEQADRMIIV